MGSLLRSAMGFLGGALIGGWLYALLWGLDGPNDAAPWGIWGLAGLALSVVVYGVRLLPAQARVAGLIAVGAITGVMLGGSVGDDGIGFWSLLMATTGGLLAVAVLPLPAAPGETPPSDVSA